MNVLTKITIFILVSLTGYTFLWVVSFYSCPHFLVFPSSKSLAQEFISSEKLSLLDSKFSNVVIRNSKVTVQCGQGSDDELEIAEISFEYSSNNTEWTQENITLYTDFDATPFSERKIVEIIYNKYPYDPQHLTETTSSQL